MSLHCLCLWWPFPSSDPTRTYSFLWTVRVPLEPLFHGFITVKPVKKMYFFSSFDPFGAKSWGKPHTAETTHPQLSTALLCDALYCKPLSGFLALLYGGLIRNTSVPVCAISHVPRRLCHKLCLSLFHALRRLKHCRLLTPAPSGEELCAFFSSLIGRLQKRRKLTAEMAFLRHSALCLNILNFKEQPWHRSRGISPLSLLIHGVSLI